MFTTVKRNCGVDKEPAMLYESYSTAAFVIQHRFVLYRRKIAWTVCAVCTPVHALLHRAVLLLMGRERIGSNCTGISVIYSTELIALQRITEGLLFDTEVVVGDMA